MRAPAGCPPSRRQQPQRRVVGWPPGLVGHPLVVRLRVVLPVIGEGLVDDGLDERQVRGGLDPADLDPVRDGPRVRLGREVYLHVPEMPDQVQARGQEQVRRGRVTRVDHMTEAGGRKPGRQAGGPLLRPGHQGGADAAPPVPRVDDTPAVGRARFLRPWPARNRRSCPRRRPPPRRRRPGRSPPGSTRPGRSSRPARPARPRRAASAMSTSATASRSPGSGARSWYPAGSSTAPESTCRSGPAASALWPAGAARCLWRSLAPFLDWRRKPHDPCP